MGHPLCPVQRDPSRTVRVCAMLCRCPRSQLPGRPQLHPRSLATLPAGKLHTLPQLQALPRPWHGDKDHQPLLSRSLRSRGTPFLCLLPVPGSNPRPIQILSSAWCCGQVPLSTPLADMLRIVMFDYKPPADTRPLALLSTALAATAASRRGWAALPVQLAKPILLLPGAALQ